MEVNLAALILLLFVAASMGGRTNRVENECSMKCDETPDPMFKAGNAYSYLYEGESEIRTTTGSYDTTGIKVKATVTVTALSHCQMKLKMSDVQIFDRTNKDKNMFVPTPSSVRVKGILEANEVLFTRSRGVVKSVCVDKDEPTWSQNMKKSIIDILGNNGLETQFLKTDRQETRHGECLVRSYYEPQLKTTVVAYDLKSCTSPRGKSLFTDLSEALVFPNSNVVCAYVQTGKDDLQSVRCEEKYTTKPLRENGNTVDVNVTIRMEKTDSKGLDMSYKNKNLVKSGIQMKEDVEDVLGEYYIKTKETIQQICVQHISPSRSEIPRSFMVLVNQLKKLTPKEVKQIYTTVMETDICPSKSDEIRSVFYDAIGFVNTPAATSVMVDLIKRNQISQADQTVWFTSLSFMQTTPTLDMIKDLETLLKTNEINKQMYLGISSVTHLYCKDNYDTCLMDPTIRNILSFFMTNLGPDCSPSKITDHISKIQISLKSLGNLKLFNEDVVKTLSKCAGTKSNPTAIRVSALEVMKHMECSKDRSVAMEILLNNENDSEMRINAYLTIMGCPDINTMFNVQKILQNEKVNQVGSFIWTHLTNIQESNDLLKKDIQRLLTNVDLKNEFDVSKLKFSRNVEKTFSLDRFSLNADSNIIFSEKSFIPRSVSLNTTAFVLGRPTNFIEMSARVEGLDDLLFKLLGPEGYLKKKTKQNTAEDNMAVINMLEEVSGNFNLKLFGQQISFVELIRGSLSSIKKYNIIEELINLGQLKSIDYKKNIILLDKVASFQTSLGFPLKFRIQGSVSVNLQVRSKLDLAGLMSWPISVNIDNQISPSIMSEFLSEVIIETPFSNYGMSMTISSGTDTEFKAIISASKNEDFAIKFEIPKKKNEIITVSGKSFVIHRDLGVEQLTEKAVKHEMCSSSESNRILGLTLCGNLQITDPEARKTALLYGPFSASVYVLNEDLPAGYVIKGLFKKVPFVSDSGAIYYSRFLNLHFDTPTSKIYYREFALDLELDFKEQLFKFRVRTPWDEILLKSSFLLSEKTKKIETMLSVNQGTILHIGMEHNSQVTEKMRMENGLITFQMIYFQPFHTKWSFVGKRNEWKIKFDSLGIFKDKTNLRLDIKEVKSTRELSLFNKYKLSGSYDTYFGKGKISGFASQNYYGHRWDVKLEHSSKENPKGNYIIMYRHKTEDKSSKSLLKYFLTSTISYGEFAENFVKFKIENELSGRHVRTIIKTSYGDSKEADKENSEMIDLQLYGGYTWKDDNVHYAEGSLSFKFPSKGVNYEGRYNSEVGKRFSKISMALDKDQQSKVNFKMNYVQPKLYLKDTEFDIALSLPNHNTNIKWVLQEVDVNKYKYTLTGAYNKYEMKIEGLQTEISRLKYDSSIRITIPALKWEKINVDLRIDLVDLSNAGFNGKIEIPNSKHKYAMDLKLSIMPQNLLQQSLSEKSSVFKYKFEVSNIERTIQSESIFTCNPEEFQVFFNFGWDVKLNPNNQVAFDIHTFHKSPNYKQFESSARITVQYPSDSHSIGFRSNFKYTELEAQIDITWNKNQRISLATTYEIDNSWTEKGLKGAITLKTPFRGMELTHLGISVMGQLRYRKVDVLFKWGGNKKVIFDLIVQPRSSNDFTLTSKLVTPFKDWTLIVLQTKYLTTTNSITSEASLELGPTRRYNIKFEGIDNSAGRTRDMKANLNLESGIFPPLKVAFMHKDDRVHFKSEFDVAWMKTESFKIKSAFSYSLDATELITTGNIEAFSTIEVIKHMKAAWSMENKDATFLNNVQIWYKSNNLFHNSIKGFFERDDMSFKMEFNGFMRISNGQPFKVTNLLTSEPGKSFVNSFSVMKDSIPHYSHSINFKRTELTFNMFVNNTEFKTINFKATNKYQGPTEVNEVWMKIGELFLFKKTSTFRSSEDILGRRLFDYDANLYSDYMTQKVITSKTKFIMSPTYIKIESVSKSPATVWLRYVTEMETGPSKQMVKFSMKTDMESLRVIEFELESVSNTNRPRIERFMFNYNDLLKAKASLRRKNLQLIDIDVFFKYNQFVRYLKLKHDSQRMGYEHLLETNLFDTTLKIVSITEARGGVAIHSTVNYKLYKVDFMGRFSRKSSELNIISTFPRTSKDLETVKVSFSKKREVYLFSIVTKTLVLTSLKLDLKEFNKFSFDFKSMEIKAVPKIDIKLNYEGGVNSLIHSNEVKVVVGKVNFHLNNKIERVSWTYLRVQSALNTNIEELSSYTLGLEYRVRPSNFDINFSANFNERFFKVVTNLVSSNELKTEFKIETSFPILREVVFEMKHKQNAQLTQVTHSCKVLLMSNERKFEVVHRIGWSGFNYINVESSIVARTSKDTYFITQKTIKFTHQFHKDVLKEDLQLLISDDIQIKALLELPLSTASKSLLEIETSFPVLKKLKVETILDVSDLEKKSLKIGIERNYERFLNAESSLEISDKRVVVSLKVEKVDSHMVEMKYDRTNPVKTELGVVVQSPLLSKTLKARVSYDSQLQGGFILVSGVGMDDFSLHMQMKNINYKVTMRYGKLFVDWDLIIDIPQSTLKLTSQLQAGNVIRLDLNVIPRSLEVSFIFNDNYCKVLAIRGEQIKLDLKVLDKEFWTQLKVLSTDPYKYELTGKTNFDKWNTFNGEAYFVNGPENLELTSRFARENTDLYNIVFRDLKKAFNVKYKTMFDVAKSGELNVQYVGEASLRFEAETINKNTIKVDFKLNNNAIEGGISSTFQWIEKVEVKGSLNQEANRIKGSFLVNHNKLKEPLKGKISYKVDSTSWEMKMETPFSEPFDKITLEKKTDSGITTMELRGQESRIFYVSLGKGTDSRYELLLDLNLPEEISNVRLSLNTSLNVQDQPYLFKMSSTSNLYSDINVQSTCDTTNNRYMVSFSHPSKRVGVTLKIAKDKTILTSEYNEKKTTVEIKHETTDVYIFDGMVSVVSNMYSSEPLSFSVACRHNINLPNAASLNLRTEWNEKIVFSGTINWKMIDPDAFDLKTEIVLTPFTKEYKGSFEVSNTKRELNIIYSPLGDSRLRDISVKYSVDSRERRLTVKTPYEPIQTIDIQMTIDRTSGSLRHYWTLKCNFIGEISAIKEVEYSPSKEIEYRYTLNTPYGYITSKDRNSPGGRAISVKAKLDKEDLKIFIRGNDKELELKVDSSIQLIKKIDILLTRDVNSYKITGSYDEYSSKLEARYSKEEITAVLITNTTYAKKLALSLIRDQTKGVTLDLVKDADNLKIAVNTKNDAWTLEWKNTLIPSLPKLVEGTFKYIRPLDVLVQVQLESKSVLNLIVSENEFLFDSEVAGRQLKLGATSSNLQVVLLDKNTFSILISRPSDKQIDISLSIGGTLYSSVLNYENISDRFYFKMISSRNSLEKLVDLYIDLNNVNREFDSELNVFNNQIFKLKLSDKVSVRRKISTELKVLSWTTIVDVDATYQENLIDFKVFWNVKFDNKQLYLGSLVYSLKSSSPINFLVTLNGQTGSYQLQLSEFEGNEFNIKISTPYKEVDLDVTGMVLYNPYQSNIKARLWAKNWIIGEYDIKLHGQYTIDPELRMIFSKDGPVFDGLLKATTSVKDEFSILTTVKLFGWEKMELTAKVENKKAIKLSMKLVTPFKILKEVSMKKTLWVKSVWEHKFETVMEYKGMFNTKFEGGHELSFIKGVVKINGKIHSEELQMVSFDIQGSKSNSSVDHMFIMDIKERRYGYKVNSKLNPFFEGKAEIYTPFHNAGVLTLQGRRFRNGASVQIERYREVFAGFEYSLNNEVRYMKITPPREMLKPLAIKHRVRRYKRSAGEQMEATVTYGKDKVVDLNSKVNMKNEKNDVFFRFSAPMLSQKTGEIKLSHKTEGDTLLFKHYLKVKDVTEQMYKIFGDLYRKDPRNFKFAVNVNHPYNGPLHFSFGHNTENNAYNSHLLMTNDNKVLIMHKGKIMFEVKKVNGELELQIPERHVRMVASHSGDLDRSEQDLKAFYNTEPYLLYKSNIVPEKTSVIEINVPIINGAKTKLTFDRPNKRIAASITTKSYEYIIDTVDKDGEFKALLQLDNEKVATLAVGYASTPLYVQGTFMKHSMKVEASLKESSIMIKSESSFPILKKATVTLRKNKITVDLNQYDQPYSFSLEYHFVPNNFFVIMETSNKWLSKASVYLTPSELKINVNEYFHILKFILTSDNLMIDCENNFLAVRVLRFNGILNRKNNNGKWKVEIDSFVAECEVNYSVEKTTLEFKNNKLFPRAVQMNLKYVNKEGAYFIDADVSVDQFKVIFLIGKSSTFKYSVELKTNIEINAAMTLDMENNEVIVGLVKAKHYLNLRAKLQKMTGPSSTTIVTSFTLDSSITIIGKTTTQISYTASKSEIFLSFLGNYLKNKIEAKAQLTKTHGVVSLSLNDLIYSAKLSVPSSKELLSEIIIPNQKVKIHLKNVDTSYTFNVQFNEKEVLKITVQQNLNFGTLFEHTSDLWYLNQHLWSLTLNTNFQRYTIKMSQPTQLDMILVNEVKNGHHVISAWVKYNLYGTLYERGTGVKLSLDTMHPLVEIHLENNVHIIKVSKGGDPLFDTKLSANLLNKLTKNIWELEFRNLRTEKLEILWKTPENSRVVKFHQTFKDNLRTSVNVELLDNLKISLESNPKTKSLDGSLTLFNKRIASIKVDGDTVKAIINDEGPEAQRISLEWTKSTRGTWRKDYISSGRLVVKQKTLNVDLDIEHTLRMETLLCSVSTKAKYLSIDGTVKTMDLGATADFSTPDQATIEFKNPIIPIKSVFKRKQPNESSLRYDMETTLNSDDKISGFFEISVGQDLGFTSRLYYDPERTSDFLEVHVGYIDNRQAELRVYTKTQSSTTNHYQILVRLLNEHSIETTFHTPSYKLWILESKINDIREVVVNKVKRFITLETRWIVKEMSKRYNQLVEIIPGATLVKDQLRDLTRKIRSEINSFSNEVLLMIKNDEFYVTSVSNAVFFGVNKVISSSIGYIQRIWRDIKDINLIRFVNAFESAYMAIGRAAYRISYNILSPLMYLSLTTIESVSPRLMYKVARNVESLSGFVKETYSVARMRINEMRKAREIFVLKVAHDFFGRLTSAVKYVFGSISGGSLNYLYQEGELKNIYNDVIMNLELLSQRILRRLQVVVSLVDDKLYPIAGDRFCSKVRKMLSDASEYVIKQLRDRDNQQRLMTMIYSTTDISFQKLNHKMSSFMKNLVLPMITIDYARSITSCIFTSPIPLNDLKSIPDFTYVSRKVEEIKDIFKLTKDMFKERLLSGHKFLELMRWFTPQLPFGSFPSFLPDFESYATILGSSVVTFDKRTMQLKPSMCKVVLAKDLRFRKWEIVLEQTKDGRMYIISVGLDKVTISMKDNKVSLNGKVAELPLTIGSAKVMAYGSVVRVKDDILGFTVTIDSINDMFTVGLSGWYHGRVRGLFGNSDNEPFNDMIAEGGRLLSGKEFMKVYSNGGTECMIDTNTETELEENKSCPFLRKVVCKFLYRCYLSPMSACFGKVDPSRFFKQCINSSLELEATLDKSICKSARSYQAQCNAAGVNVPVPPPCRKCDVKGEKPYLVNDYKNIKNKEKVADIVFLIDEGKCLSNIRTQVPLLVTKLDASMKEKGISSTRFGLVTFGGDGVNEAHSHTINQKLFGSAEEMFTSTKSLQSTDQSIKDTVGAITLGSSYPFRAHASKHLVLINCDPCGESSGRLKSLLEVLEKQAIQFSMLTDFNFQVKDGDSKKMIYGVDSKNVYTSVSRRGEIVKDVRRPDNDFCYQLAMNRNGVVFNINYLISKTEVTQKRFIETFTTQVSLTAIPARTTTCKCADDGEYNCVPLDTYSIFPAKKST